MIPAITSITTAAQALQGLNGTGAEKSAISAGVSGAQPTPFSELLTDAVGQVDQLEA